MEGRGYKYILLSLKLNAHIPFRDIIIELQTTHLILLIILQRKHCLGLNCYSYFLHD